MNKGDTLAREKYLKSGRGKSYLKKRLKRFLFRTGFTVLELLVVIGIIAIISGIGLAVLSHSSRQFSFQSTRGEIVSMIRYTRSNALTEKGSTAVVINPTSKQIYSCVRRTLGLWHFEDIVRGSESSGAFNNNAKLQGDAVIAVAGRYGFGLSISSTGYADCGTIPIISNTTGLSLDCWISPTLTSMPTQRTIINLTGGGIILDDTDSIKISYGSLNVNSPASIIPYGRWSQINMTFEPDYVLADGSGTLSLYINDILIVTTSGNAGIVPAKWNLNVGGPTNNFSGMIDEVKVSMIGENDRLNLAPEITIYYLDVMGFIQLTQTLPIRFDRNGNLIQLLPQLKIKNSATNDSFILEFNNWGGVKIW